LRNDSKLLVALVHPHIPFRTETQIARHANAGCPVAAERFCEFPFPVSALLAIHSFHQPFDCYVQCGQLIHFFYLPHCSATMPAIVFSLMTIFTESNNGKRIALLNVMRSTRAGFITD
jgi:hypothetical protein